MLDEKLLAILACPVCKAPLRLDEQGLVCTRTLVRYPVEEGIPILLADKAVPPHPEAEKGTFSFTAPPPAPGSQES